jgi:hypothetical protein
MVLINNVQIIKFISQINCFFFIFVKPALILNNWSRTLKGTKVVQTLILNVALKYNIKIKSTPKQN